MERGREGRRGGAGGGPVYAPRRPRTGFKDAAVGDDADDIMDDVHNPRLRERPKKDSSGVTSGQALVSTSVVSSSRNKRKRQGSQEVQVHARGSPADDLEETTEDTEMVASEDDDDHPPPIIPRRPGKLRPQGKIAEDGITVDLPAVPRKARTAILKRPQESLPPPPADIPSHQPSAVIASTPAPSSTPSSSSIASLKPGRRTKPSSSKIRGSKLPKATTPTPVSEQEVEVAEALFDLARMFTQPSVSSVDAKSEAKSSSHDLKSESKVDAKAFASAVASTQPMHPSNGPCNFSSSMSAPASVSQAVSGGGVSPIPASAASPVPSPSPPPGAGPASEAPKRKRPRIRTRPEEGPSNQCKPAASPASALSSAIGANTPQIKEAEQGINWSSIADRGAVKVEASATTAPAVCTAVPSLMVSTIVTSSMPMASSAASPMISSSVVPCSVPRPSISLEKRASSSEKKNVTTVAKPEHANPSFVEKKPAIPLLMDKKASATSLLVSLTSNNREVDSTVSTSSLPESLTARLEIGKRSPRPAAAMDDDPSTKQHIDLMASPSKLPAASTNERNGDRAEAGVQDVPGKPIVDLAIAPTGETTWLDKELKSEEKQALENDKEAEKEWEMEHEHCEGDGGGDKQSELDYQRELTKDREKQRERHDISKISAQRSSKSQKVDIGRSQKAVSATAAAAASFLASGPPGSSSATTGVAALPLSMGMLSWPGGIPGGLSYFPPAAAEDNSPSVQLPPYIMPPRQAWKRCALHVYIARFIDMQQQLNSHHPFYTSANNMYGAKPYNLNMPLSPVESLFGNATGAPLVGCASGPSAASSSAAAVNLEASDRGLSAAANAAAASIHGSKERAYHTEVLTRKPPAQQQSSHQQAAVAMQPGPAFGLPGTQTGTASVTGATPTPATSASSGGANLLPPGSGMPGSNSASGSSSAMLVGAGPHIGAPSTASNGATATAAVHAQYMHAMMQQSQSFPFTQYPPPHFGPATFNGPPSHMATPQAAAQFFAGSPFFTTHLVSHTQQPVNTANIGPASIPKQQQASRSFPQAGSPQQQVPPPQSPSRSQQQLSSQQLQRPSDRDAPIVGDNGSTADSKFSMMHRTLYAQASPNTSVSNASPPAPAVLSGGLQTISLPSPDYNMVTVLGKQSKQRDQQSQQSSGLQQSQSQQSSTLSSQLQQQHHSPGAALQMSVKGVEPQTTQSFSMSMTAVNRGSVVGPGPLGLAPVAAVMAPQGHAMLQSIGDSGRGHLSSQAPHHQLNAGTTHSNMQQQQQQHQHQHQQQMQQQQQQHLIQLHQVQQQQAQAHQQLQQQQQQQQQQQSTQPQPQQQRGIQVHRGTTSGSEDSRTILDGNITTSIGRGRDRESLDDRKMIARRPIGPASPLSRDMEGSTSILPSPTCGGGMATSRNVGTTLNLMAPTNPNMSSRSSGHPQPMSVSTSISQQVIQASKQTGCRSKGIPGSNTTPSAGANQSSLTSFPERVPTPGAPVQGKVPSPGLSLPGQQNATASSQGTRHTQVSQHSQIKLNQRTSMGPIGVPTPPTVPGTALQVVLAAAMAKNPQVQQQQHRSQQGVLNPGSSQRMSTSMPGPPSSSPVPLPPLPPVSKSSGPNPLKTASSQKGPFPVSQKSSATSGKRSSSPSHSHPSSILGPSPLAQNISVQNISVKTSQQQVQNHHSLAQPQMQSSPHNSQQGQQQQRFPQPQQQGQLHKQSLSPQQQQTQQTQQTQQMVRQHLQHHHHQQTQLHMYQNQQQQQQPSHSQSLQAGPAQQTSQQPSPHQQQSSQPQQQPSPSQLQQHSSLQLQHLQQQQQPPPQSTFPSTASNGGLTLGSVLSLGTGNNGTCSTRNSNSEIGGTSQGRPLHSTKQSAAAGVHMANSGSQRSNSTGPTFLQQFGSSALPSVQQQSGSPRNSNPSTYMQAGVPSGGGGRSSDAKLLPDGQEQLNGVRTMQGSSPARPSSTMSSSPAIQPSCQRTQAGGSLSSKPASGHYTGTNYVENIQSRSSILLSGANNSTTAPNNTSHGQTNSNTSLHIGGDGRAPFVSGVPPSFDQGTLNSSQMHSPSSISMATTAIAPSGPAPLISQQPTTNVVQP